MQNCTWPSSGPPRQQLAQGSSNGGSLSTIPSRAESSSENGQRSTGTGLNHPDSDALEPLALLGWTAENALGTSADSTLGSQAGALNLSPISTLPTSVGPDTTVTNLLNSPEVELLPNNLPFGDILGGLDLDEVSLHRIDE